MVWIGDLPIQHHQGHPDRKTTVSWVSARPEVTHAGSLGKVLRSSESVAG